MFQDLFMVKCKFIIQGIIKQNSILFKGFEYRLSET